MPDRLKWPDTRIIDLLDIEIPIVQAPMAGAGLSDLAIAVAEAGALGSLPCAMLTAGEAGEEITKFRRSTTRPAHLNFFCHRPAEPRPESELQWRERLAPYYAELG